MSAKYLSVAAERLLLLSIGNAVLKFSAMRWDLVITMAAWSGDRISLAVSAKRTSQREKWSGSNGSWRWVIIGSPL